MSNLFWIFSSEHGEGIIKTHEANTLKNYSELYKERWADRNGWLQILKNFMEAGYITKINLPNEL